MPLLQVQGLSVSIGEAEILKSVSFDLEAGEILGLVGESGSGKSMTSLAIMGLLPPRAHRTGRILLDGVDLASASEAELCKVRGRDIGMVFQEPMTALNPLMTIGDQVAETVRLHRGVPAGEAKALARAALERVGLPAERFPLSRYPHELSGGQRQRVAIAIAVAMGPKLIVADEPTTALDVTTQAQILELLKRLVREDGAGLVLITHDLGVVAETADRVAIMKAGEIVEQGATADVFRTMQHPYSRRLLADAAHTPARRPRTARGERPLLEVRGVRRRYPGPRRLMRRTPGRLAVDDVSFVIQPGENLGLVGESGCGKSTLLRTILALDPPQAGDVLVKGEAITTARGSELKRLRRDVQVVFQDPFGSFDPRWKVSRLVAENFHLMDQPPAPAAARRRVDEMLESVGLSSSDADRFPHEFSGGQRQRIAIARALVTNPALVALDEAVSALDVTIRAQILDLLADLSDRLGVSYLFVTHDLNVVRTITDRVMVMREGRIVEAGSTAQVFAAPQDAYTRALLEATPSLERAMNRNEQTLPGEGRP